MKEDIAEIKTDIKHIIKKLDSMDKNLATKSEVGFIQIWLTGVTGAIAYIFKYITGGL